MIPNYKYFSLFVSAFLICHFSVSYAQSRVFYGMTAEGGINNTGTIFKMDAGNTRLNTIYSFPPKMEGSQPLGGLTQAGNGKVYGVTSQGGKFSGGILFEWDPATNIYIKRLDFKDSMGYRPMGSLLLAENGKLYGRTFYGGINSTGTVFEWDPETGVFSKVYDFEKTEYQKYYLMYLMQATNGKIYGYTSGEGAGDETIFEIDPITHVYSTKLNFKLPVSGAEPVGTLTEGDNHKLYGVTEGELFEWDPGNNIFIRKKYFPYNFGVPKSSLLKASNGKFYGICMAALYEWDPVKDTLIAKITLDAIETGNNGHGALVEAGNGVLYGTNSNGGYYHHYVPSDGETGPGTLFEWDIASNEFSKKLDFDGYNKGANPNGLIVAKNGNLYGMTLSGGPNNEGLLFEWNPVTGTYSKKLNFNLSGNDLSSLNQFTLADNGKLTGVSSFAGEHMLGAIYELDTLAYAYSKLFEFKGDSTGIYPSGNLVRAGNGKWYGFASHGGKYGDGVLYEWDPASGTLIKKLDFNGLETGRYPIGSLTEGKNGKLYGVTQRGGIGLGLIFEWDPITEIFTKKYDFSEIHGQNPNSSLVRGSNGLLYGTTSNRSYYGYGILFEWNPEMNSYRKRVDLDSQIGPPCGSLIQAGNGKLYGMTSAGDHGYGVIYEYDPETYINTVKFRFKWYENGYNPYGSLVQGGDGKLYGTTKKGGIYDKGVFFKWDPESGDFEKLIDFNGNENGASPIGGLVEISHSLQDTIYVEACGNYITPSGKYTFNRTGIYKDFLKSVSGNDSILTIYLTSKNSWSQISLSVCDSFVVPSGRHVYTSSGVYNDTIPNAAGCDSIITIILNLTKTRNTLNISACHSYTSPSGKYTWYKEGTYSDTLFNTYGCDVVNTINLKFPGNTTSTIYVSEYNYYRTPSGIYLSNSGIYTDKIKNSFGCDSIITIYLTIGAHSNKYLNIAASCSYTSPSGKFVWDSSGIYQDTIPTKTGGDSILIITLEVTKSAIRKIHARGCGHYISPSGKYDWDTGGFYTDTISTGSGCDSIFSIDLIFDKVYTGVIQDCYSLKSIDVPASHQWIDCDNGNIPIEGATDRIFTATHSGHYAVVVSNGACVDTSAIHEVIINTVTGLVENTFESDIRLYPNPTEGNVSIDLGRVYTDVEVAITGPDGKALQKDRLKQTKVTSLTMPEPAGIYIVTVTSGNELAVFRIVKR
jgi:uncharacterized repeat protein (TIGR03803 family)